MISNNTTIFKRDEVTNFCTRVDIKQKFIFAPGHPFTNSLTERYVQIIKNKLKAMSTEETPIREKIQETVFRFRATSLAESNSPAEPYLHRHFHIKFNQATASRNAPFCGKKH